LLILTLQRTVRSVEHHRDQSASDIIADAVIVTEGVGQVVGAGEIIGLITSLIGIVVVNVISWHSSSLYLAIIRDLKCTSDGSESLAIKFQTDGVAHIDVKR
jgi:sensor histidine kinase YesM